MEESQYFVQIKDPLDIRKGILSSSRQIIQILQRYERIKALRVKKLEKISHLRSKNKEINLLVVKLKKAFPAAEMRVRVGKEQQSMKKGKKAYSGDDLAKLEEELRMVEAKIGKLA
jgi:hypothetical protein